MGDAVTGPLFKAESADILRQEWVQLRINNLRHWALVSAANALSVSLFGRPLVLTDIYRPDPNSVHSDWRGTDVRIANQAREVPQDYRGIYLYEARTLANYLNDTFEYKKHDGTVSDVAVIHGEGLNLHIHLQTPAGDMWRA